MTTNFGGKVVYNMFKLKKLRTKCFNKKNDEKGEEDVCEEEKSRRVEFFSWHKQRKEED